MDVVFRIQTTSPATYRVKPSNGRLKSSAPVATIEITMTSTPVKADKFLVKYAAVPESQVEDSAKLLAEAGAAVQDRRLKVQVIEENTVVPSQGLVEDQSPLAKAQAKIEELTLALKVAQDALKNKQVNKYIFIDVELNKSNRVFARD